MYSNIQASSKMIISKVGIGFLIVSMLVGWSWSQIPPDVKKAYKEIKWEDLLPEKNSISKLMKKYQEQLYRLQDNDPSAVTLFDRITSELNSLPPNKKLDKVKVRLPGFMAPLEMANGEISEMLLVPYFGQCIHSPPPPVNQTVFVKFKKGHGVPESEYQMPIWLYGTIEIKKQKTDLAESGYEFKDAYYEIYDDLMPSSR